MDEKQKLTIAITTVLALFDFHVLETRDNKYLFRGRIFEYKFECNAADQRELLQKMGDFLVTIPKYLWSLKKI